jgi:hypothetical protein
VTAAAAINLLQEADDTRLGPDIEDMEKTLEDAGRRLLQLMARYYSDERTMALGGEDGSWDVRRWKGQMLNGNDDVSVQAGSGMPRSKAAKQAAMSDVLNLAIQNGLEIDQRSLKKFASISSSPPPGCSVRRTTGTITSSTSRSTTTSARAPATPA